MVSFGFGVYVKFFLPHIVEPSEWVCLLDQGLIVLGPRPLASYCNVSVTNSSPWGRVAPHRPDDRALRARLVLPALGTLIGGKPGDGLEIR